MNSNRVLPTDVPASESVSDSLDGYHPMVRDFILGKGCFSQEAQIEAARRVGEKMGKAAAEAMNESLLEAFAPALDLAQTPGGSGVFDANGDEVPWEGVVAALTAERDTAIRERDAARDESKRLLDAQVKAAQERDRAHEARGRIRLDWKRRGLRLHLCYAQIGVLRARVAELEAERDGLSVDVMALNDVGHRLGSQVAELESQLESVACRAATAETALEAAPAARDLYDIGHKISPFMTLLSDLDGCILEMKFKSYSEGAALHGAMVRFFKSAPAKSGAAVSADDRQVMENAVTYLLGVGEAGSEPHALGKALRLVMTKEVFHPAPAASGAAGTATWFAAVGMFGMKNVCMAFNSFEKCEKFADGEVPVVPLYAAPQPAKGWLTAEEQEAVAGIALVIDRLKLYPQQLCRTKKDDLDLLWRIAGVPDKEVGRE